MTQHEEILAAIKESRRVNDEQHERIFASAETSEKLASQIQKALTAWEGFKTTVSGIKSMLIYVGILYLIFKEPLHALIMGG